MDERVAAASTRTQRGLRGHEEQRESEHVKRGQVAAVVTHEAALAADRMTYIVKSPPPCSYLLTSLVGQESTHACAT